MVETRSVHLKISEETLKAIEIAIQIGYCKTVSDFGEKAIVSKLEELGIFSEKIRKYLR